jgi:DNA-binding NarL/FixJ family response regulator
MPLPTILVEDSATIRESLVPAMVEFADAQIVAVAETAREGIAALHRHADTWRLAVVDIFLREGNGLDVLRASTQRQAGQRVVVLTNYATPDIRRRALAAGADAVFDKSTEIDQFLEQCRAYAEE